MKHAILLFSILVAACVSHARILNSGHPAVVAPVPPPTSGSALECWDDSPNQPGYEDGKFEVWLDTDVVSMKVMSRVASLIDAEFGNVKIEFDNSGIFTSSGIVKKSYFTYQELDARRSKSAPYFAEESDRQRSSLPASVKFEVMALMSRLERIPGVSVGCKRRPPTMPAVSGGN